MRIRTARPDDAERLLEIYAPYVRETAVTFEYDVPEVSAFRERIEKTLTEHPYIVAEDESGIVGYAYSATFHFRAAYKHSAETSIYVDKNSRGRGAGRLLYERLEELLKAQNVYVLYACISSTDRADDPYLTDASIRFHTKLGYTLAGRHTDCGWKFDRWYSVVWMEKELSRRPEKPQLFIPFPKLSLSAETE